MVTAAAVDIVQPAADCLGLAQCSATVGSHKVSNVSCVGAAATCGLVQPAAAWGTARH
jgi:hypothetical protein